MSVRTAHRNIAIMGASIFCLGLGEEMWMAYMPKYLSALGASTVLIGLFASGKDLLDGVWQYPGGWLTDHLGRKKALIFFTATAMCGYGVYASAGNWAIMPVGLLMVMAWKSGAFPSTFAVIGDALPKGKRVVAFSIQSILVRLPRVIGAPIGGMLIATYGISGGVRRALVATIVFAFVVVISQAAFYRSIEPRRTLIDAGHFFQVFQKMDSRLKSLLFSDCVVRIGDGISSAFIVLYVTNVLGFSAPQFGFLYAIQMAVAISLYLPMGKFAELTGRRPLVALTFLFFALFPLAVSFASTWPLLVCAFVLGGMKEMGEPARKSMIVDLSDPTATGRSVGVYYTLRNLLVVPAGVAGGLLYRQSPALALHTAGGICLLGVVSYLVLFSKHTEASVLR